MKLVPEYLMNRVHDSRDLEPSESLEIRFRPGQPGDITVAGFGLRLIINPRDPTSGQPTTEPGRLLIDSTDLGSIATSVGAPDLSAGPVTPGVPETIRDNRLPRRVELLRPDSGIPVAALNDFAETELVPELHYEVRSSDLESSGSWMCRVTNLSNSTGTFVTNLSYVSDIEIHKATFDLALLNYILSRVMGAADIEIHLQTSPPGQAARSYIHWAEHILIQGRNAVTFKLDDFNFVVDPGRYLPNFRVRLRLRGMDTHKDFRGPSLRVIGVGQIPAVEVSTGFKTEGIELIGTATRARIPVSVDIQHLRVSVQFRFDGTPTVDCNIIAMARIGGRTVDDVSDRVRPILRSIIFEKLREIDAPEFVSTWIPNFFTGLMRLGARARIYSARIIGGRLELSYYHESLRPLRRLERTVIRAGR